MPLVGSSIRMGDLVNALLARDKTGVIDLNDGAGLLSAHNRLAELHGGHFGNFAPLARALAAAGDVEMASIVMLIGTVALAAADADNEDAYVWAIDVLVEELEPLYCEKAEFLSSRANDIDHNLVLCY
jgi:hypothetical protein